MQEVSLACQGLRPRGTGRALAIARPAMLPSATRTASASRTRSLSRLNTWPTNTPVNASSQTSRPDTHDSGPIWLALPFIVRYLSSSPLADLPAHPRRFAPNKKPGSLLALLSTDRGREGRYPPRPPNRACGSPAHGSPVAGSLSGISRVFKSCLKGEEPLIREEGISLPPWTPLPSADTMRSVQIDASVHHSPWASPLVASLPGVAVMALSGFSCAIQTFRIQLPSSLPSGRFCCPSFPPPAAASVL